METSVAMCKLAAESGTEGIVCSAHANDRYEFSPERVQAKIDEVSKLSGGKPRLYPGCDFHLSYQNIQHALAEPTRFTINHGHYLLVEFADFAIPPNIDQVFFQFQTKGIRPIITHPERNPWLISRRDHLVNWAEQGALVQVTAGSLLGRFGRTAGGFARWLIEHRLLHLVASDGHNTSNRPPVLKPAYEQVKKEFDRQTADVIFKDWPEAVIQDQLFDVPPPIMNPRRTFFTRVASAFRKLESSDK